MCSFIISTLLFPIHWGSVGCCSPSVLKKGSLPVVQAYCWIACHMWGLCCWVSAGTWASLFSEFFFLQHWNRNNLPTSQVCCKKWIKWLILNNYLAQCLAYCRYSVNAVRIRLELRRSLKDCLVFPSTCEPVSGPSLQVKCFIFSFCIVPGVKTPQPSSGVVKAFIKNLLYVSTTWLVCVTKINKVYHGYQ